MADEDDDLMMNEWLDMVQKKNELVREESELIYRLPYVLLLISLIIVYHVSVFYISVSQAER